MSAIFDDGKNAETADRIMACVSVEVSCLTGMLCLVNYIRAQDAFVGEG
jgi:hypothetical protein